MARAPHKGSEGEGLPQGGEVRFSPLACRRSPFTDGETEAHRNSEPGPGSGSKSKEKPGLLLAKRVSKWEGAGQPVPWGAGKVFS